MAKKPFWETKPLDKMSPQEWESLCDGCGKCCLNKVEDIDTKRIYFTDAACKLLNTETGRCTNYKKRGDLVPDCHTLTPRKVKKMNCLPASCAYRLLNDGKKLKWWHPLVSGDPNLVHEVGMSVIGRVISEEKVKDLQDRIVKWPMLQNVKRERE